MTELGDGPLGRPARPTAAAAAAGRRRSPSSTRRRSAGPRIAVRADPRQPEHRARDGPARRAGRRDRRARRSPGRTDRAGPCWRRRRSGSGRPDRARRTNARHAPPRPPRRRPRRSRSPTISEPSPSTLARTLASNRSRAVARTDSLTMTPTRRGSNGATQTSGRRPERGQPSPCVDDRRLDEVRRDLDARDEVAARDDLAVEDA